MIETLDDRTLLTLSFIPQGAGQWIEEGPRGVAGAQVEGIDMQNNGFRNPIAGAVQQLALFDVAGGKKGAYAATVSGGIWKTDNISDPNPQWVPKSESHKIKAISSIIVHPTNSNIVFAGTGSVTSGGNINVGDGILQSTDGGMKWKTLPTKVVNAALDANGKPVKSSLTYPTVIGTVLYPHSIGSTTNQGNTLIAATSLGLVENVAINDSSLTWTRISGSLGLPKGATSDMVEVLETSQTQTRQFFVGVPTKGIYRSADLITWTELSLTGNCTANVKLIENIKFAVHGQGSTSVLYAGLVFNIGTEKKPINVTHIFKFTNDGNTCESLGTPSTVESDGQEYFLNAGNQGDTHFSIAAHPTNSNVVFVGGDRQPFTDSVAGNTKPSVGRLFYYHSASNQWKHLTSEDSAVDITFPHADSRSLVYVSDTTGSYLLETDDGGIYRLSNPDSTGRVWTSRMGSLDATGKTLGISEVYSVAHNRRDESFFAGLQDNGTVVQSQTTDNDKKPWFHERLGDGSTQAFRSFGSQSAGTRLALVSRPPL